MAALDRESAIPLTGLTNQKIERFSQAVAHLLRAGDAAFRRAYLRLFIEDIEAKDGELRLTGSEHALAAVVANSGKMAEGAVHAFVHEWRANRNKSANCWNVSVAVESRSKARTVVIRRSALAASTEHAI